MFSLFKKLLHTLSNVWLFLIPKKLGCFTHLMISDPNIFCTKLNLNSGSQRLYIYFDQIIVLSTTLYNAVRSFTDIKIHFVRSYPEKKRSDMMKQNIQLTALFNF